LDLPDSCDPALTFVEENHRMGESRKGVIKTIMALLGVTVILSLGTWLVVGSEPRLGPLDGLGLPGIDTGRVAVGDVAPDFSLMSYAGTVTTLSDFRGDKNVVLVFYRGHW
jgi:cytochrome oxidase Cu insertion factor (SCO1/SenC/PrrC family)